MVSAMRPLLLVIDLQNGFVTDKTTHILPGVKHLMATFARADLPVAFTRFINQPNGAHVNWIGWSRLMAAPEIDLVAEVQDQAINVFDKPAYTAFTAAFTQFVELNAIDTLVLCGIATDGCVLKTAVDAFERTIKPLVVQDACASHAGHELHLAGLQLLARFIGKRQIVTIQEVVQQWAFGDTALTQEVGRA